MALNLPAGVQITAPVKPEWESILSTEALALVAKLHRAFEARRQELLKALVALDQAIAQFQEEGGRSARLARYTQNYRVLVDGMAALGFKPFLRPEVQAPIIVTFHAPAHPAYVFRRFYEAAKARGFILYPGKLTQIETFRVGCIGAIGRNEMQQAVNAVADTLRVTEDADE
jgi:aspartate aminotransferase-like enzyme